MSRTVAIVTMGCARNEVDSEELAGRLAAEGWTLVADADSAEVAEDIDLERARRAHERALERINVGDHEVNIERARLSMLRALNRMRIVEKNI